MMQNLLELHLRIMLKTTDDILRNFQLLTSVSLCTMKSLSCLPKPLPFCVKMVVEWQFETILF